MLRQEMDRKELIFYGYNSYLLYRKSRNTTKLFSYVYWELFAAFWILFVVINISISYINVICT